MGEKIQAKLESLVHGTAETAAVGTLTNLNMSLEARN